MFNIYVDGIYDLFHAGHVTTLKNIKYLKENVYLIVGVVNDKDATIYKREPIINEYNRYFSRDEMLVFISHVQLSLMENDKKTHRYKTIHDILIFILNKYNNPKMDYKLLIYKNLTIEYCNFMYDMYVKYNKKSSKMKLIE